ncbi:hypothetical protein BH24ACT9_BH24ACT9_01800 [soil metagenome]
MTPPIDESIPSDPGLPATDHVAERHPQRHSDRAAARDGLIVLVASLGGHLGNFLFYVLGARALDPAGFAELASLTSLALIVLTPVSGVQAAMARDVAQATVRADSSLAGALIRWLFWRILLLQTLLFAVFALATPAAFAVLRLSSPGVWLLASLWFALSVSVQALLGPIQGLSRFPTMAWILAGPLGLVRLVFALPLVLLLGLPGALIALIGATLIGLGTVIWSLRRHLVPLRTLPKAGRHPAGGARTLGLPVTGLLAFASITNIDIVAAKIGLTSELAATYSSAALLGKVALYATVSLGFVLLPRLSERIARGQDYARATLLTMAVVVGVGLLTGLAFLVASEGLIVAVFGATYEQAAGLILPITLIMTVAGVLNVHLTLAIARRDRIFVGGFLAVAVLHAGALLLYGESTTDLIATNAVVLGSALVLWEVFSSHGAVRMLIRRLGADHRSEQPADE